MNFDTCLSLLSTILSERSQTEKIKHSYLCENSQKIRFQWLKTSHWLPQAQWDGKEGLAIKAYIENILEKL